MKRLLIPLAAAGLSATSLALPAAAEPNWVSDPLAAKPAEAYSAAAFWLEANGAALRKATQYHWDSKKVQKLVTTQAKTPDSKPSLVEPIGTAKPAARTRNVNVPKTIGKVFFVDRAGRYRWCSATSVQSRNRNLVATAGHCVFEKGKDVFQKWVFIPAYYQGSAPFGVYAGAYAFTHYDLDTYDDYDGDYAFVAVHNGFSLDKAKEVAKADFTGWKGDKQVKSEEITKAEFDTGLDKFGPLGPYWSKTLDTADKVGPAYLGEKTLTKVEVTKDAYTAAPASTNANLNGEKFEQVGPTPISREEYRKLAGEKADGKVLGFLAADKDSAGNETAWTLTRYYTKQWVKADKQVKYFRDRYYVAVAKDAGRLGDTVGGQGLAWNQPLGQAATVFGYPSAPHPDGDRPFTGVTPKWCSGKTGTKRVQANMFRVETHQTLRCSMTPGADGGPWLVRYDNAKRAGYLNGVTSVFYDQDGNERIDYVSSPYFDSETASVYDKAGFAETKSIVGADGEVRQ
ncbi:hypothetical protein [Nonomuraea longicatena]|uniref:Uncharacterized protein n=1 Tax=Nonomuraea longicatena TaxID=83682 RepID=A0ABP3ZGM5_9ACTN